MIVGVPTEVKDDEYRVAMTPGGVHQLVVSGHQVRVETGAGLGSGFSDEQYETAGAALVPTASEAWAADMVVKVKEPQPSEYAFMRPDLALFTYLHLAADERLTREMMARQLTGIAYETVELPNGSLPLLTPMSEVAGRLAIQMGANSLERTAGGQGVLLGGVPGVPPAEVVIIGAGVVGISAAQIALGMGAQVTIIDINLDRLRYLNEVMNGRLVTLMSSPYNVAEAVGKADLVIGAVLIKGAKAPKLVTHAMIRSMRPGTVVVDVAVDQGGCIETTRPTTHSHPTYVVDGVIHCCVANMPGAVPRTSTYALSNATLAYVVKLANLGVEEAIRSDPPLRKGVNTRRGHITYAAVAEAFSLPYTPVETLC